MARQSETIDAHVYRQPTPAQVAALIDSHGLDAATTRWHYVGERTLSSMARTHRRSQGVGVPYTKRRSYTEVEAAVLVEAAAIFGSATSGERAAGVCDSASITAHQARGLTAPRISSAARGALASLGRRANHGDAAAVAERDAIHAHERAVGAVLRAALALVPEQPGTGRYRLPPVDDALRAALADLDPAAIAAVFPDLVLPPPAAIEEPAVAETVPPAPQPAVETVSGPAPLPHRRVPSDSAIRGDHAGGGSLVAIAAAYGVQPTSLYTHWARLGLSGRGRLAGYETSVQRAARIAQEAAASPSEPAMPTREPVAPVPPAAPSPAPRQVPVFVAPRLGLDDLALAVALAQRTGLPTGAALRWVREDLAMARAEEVLEANARAYEARAHENQAMDALFEALADGDHDRIDAALNGFEGPRQ
jgi:hypothetical protein